MFWTNFYNLCVSVGTSPNAVCKELGFSSATSTHWKNGTTPNGDAIVAIADRFGCSTDYLLGRTDNPEIHIKDSSIQIHDITNSGTQAIGNNIKLENIKDSEQLKSDITDQEYELIKMLREMPFENNFKCLQFIMGMYKEGKQ